VVLTVLNWDALVVEAWGLVPFWHSTHVAQNHWSHATTHPSSKAEQSPWLQPCVVVMVVVDNPGSTVVVLTELIVVLVPVHSGHASQNQLEHAALQPPEILGQNT